MKRGIAGKKQKPERNVSTKARPPREEKAIRKRISADAFSAAGHFVVARFFCCRLLETAVLPCCLRRSVFELKRGVSLSAAARSAAALVYDKLTPNCHPVHIIPSAYSLVQALFYRRKLLHPL